MVQQCYGKRREAWNKCEECVDIVACSIITLEAEFGDKIDIVV